MGLDIQPPQRCWPKHTHPSWHPFHFTNVCYRFAVVMANISVMLSETNACTCACMHVCAHTCVCMHACMHAGMCVWYVCLCVFASVCAHLCLCTFVCVCVCVWICVCVWVKVRERETGGERREREVNYIHIFQQKDLPYMHITLLETLFHVLTSFIYVITNQPMSAVKYL